MFKKVIFAAALVLLFSLSACAAGPTDATVPEEAEVPTTTPQPLPAAPEEVADEIEAWIEYSRDLFLGQARSYEGKLYLLVTYGIQPTEGFNVEIGEAVVLEESVQVNVTFSRPGEDEAAAQVLTRPYALLVIDDPALPVEFIVEGDETYVPTLLNLPYLPELMPIEGDSLRNFIRVFAPLPQPQVGAAFVVEGVANVFEGNVLYRLMDEQGNVLEQGFTTAAMVDWGHFVIELQTPEGLAAGDPLRLELYTESAEDGSEQDLIGFALSVVE